MSAVTVRVLDDALRNVVRRQMLGTGGLTEALLTYWDLLGKAPWAVRVGHRLRGLLR